MPCEAQSIHLYQRITKVLETLVNRVDEETEMRMEAFDRRIRAVWTGIESLNPKISHLNERLAGLQEMVSGQLERTAEVGSQHQVTHIGGLTGDSGLGKGFASWTQRCDQFTADAFSSCVVCIGGQRRDGVFA